MGLLDDAIREHLDLKRRRGADPAEVERAEREALGPVRRGPEEPEQAAPPADVGVAYDHQDEPEWHEPFTEPGDEHIPTGVVDPEPLPSDFGDQPAASEPLSDEFAAEAGAGAAGAPAGFDREPEQYEPEPQYEAEGAPAQPEPLALEEQPKRRGFLGRRKQQPVVPEPEDHRDYLDHDDDDPFAEPEASAPPAPHPAPAPPQGVPERPREQAGGETVEYEVEAAFEAEGEKSDEDVLEETPEFLQDTPDHDRLWFEQRPPRDFDFDG